MKNFNKVSKVALIALITASFILPSFAHAEEDTASSHFFSFTSIIRSIFQRNVSEKKENLEKNRDIRNKLIEEKQAKLNVKFNLSKEEPTPDPEIATGTPAETIIEELNDQIVRLSDIKVRIDTHLQSLATTTAGWTAAYQFSNEAGKNLITASSSIAYFLGTSTPETISTEGEASSTLSFDTKRDALIKSVQNIKDAHIALIKAIAELSGTIDDATSTASTTEATN